MVLWISAILARSFMFFASLLFETFSAGNRMKWYLIRIQVNNFVGNEAFLNYFIPELNVPAMLKTSPVSGSLFALAEATFTRPERSRQSGPVSRVLLKFHF